MIVDTSNTIDSSIFLKARLEKNMVGSNYYIENLQDRRNRDWEFRYNVVEIEEEVEKDIKYTDQMSEYTPIEVVVSNVKTEFGADLNDDFLKLSFKDLKYPTKLGKRYRFSLDFPNIHQQSEEEKHFDSSIWITINKSSVRAGNSCVVRRCNTFLSMIGSPNNSNSYISEIHQEPCILENQLKYMQVYYNQVAAVPQSEWYATVQMNYYTNAIKINDRLLFGAVDPNNRSNNQVYKVKAVIKSAMDKTFTRNLDEEIQQTPIIILALDKDNIAAEDNFIDKIAQDAPIYKSEDIAPSYDYYIKSDENNKQRIILGEECIYVFSVCYNNQTIDDANLTFALKLNGILEKNWGNYFSYEKVSSNSIKITNLKACNRGSLQIQVSGFLVGGETPVCVEHYEIELGSFY